MNSKKSRKKLIIVFITLILLILTITNNTKLFKSVAKTGVADLLEEVLVVDGKKQRKSYGDLALSRNGIDMRTITIDELRESKWVPDVNKSDSDMGRSLTWGSAGKGAIYCVQRTTGDRLNYNLGGLVAAAIIDIKGNDVFVYSKSGESDPIKYTLSDSEGCDNHSYVQWLAAMIYHRRTEVKHGGYESVVGSMYNLSHRSFL